MKILLCGDVLGRSGREAVAKYLPGLKKDLSVDLALVNVDNAAHGFGVTPEMVYQFLEMGADVLTGGNHLFDQREAVALLEKEKRLLRPANMSSMVPGTGVLETSLSNGLTVAVVHLIGQKFMPLIGENPFDYMNKFLLKYKMGENVRAIVVDFHAEITSEKIALGYFLDGRVSAVVGTHTHVPTADERILERGTAFQTDVGMCGDYDSIIGMQKKALEVFAKGYSHHRFSPASGEATFCSLLVNIDDSTGLATSVERIIVGGQLKASTGDTIPRNFN
ncbi:MAG: YmdB family metallophosphoesterase [Holosporaceae bacterium]|jgi:metallophosphoesterase (TIGR00282 family)|nr:YmdB family metallophosphoesterase [Holosporaceae bacterium]